MTGAAALALLWAGAVVGELGPAQFTPSDYISTGSTSTVTVVSI